jgi:hypothetical protein
MRLRKASQQNQRAFEGGIISLDKIERRISTNQEVTRNAYKKPSGQST